MISHGHIIKVTLDERTIIRRSPEIEHERAVAIADLLDGNIFAPIGVMPASYHLHLAIADNRLQWKLSHYNKQDGIGEEILRFTLAISSFRSIVRDYFLICESYYDALKQNHLNRVEAIDMGRRGIHNEGSELLTSLLADKITLDLDTARRLFTLICVLHIK